MAGVVVWSFHNDRQLWSAYDPDVSTELERLYHAGGTTEIGLGTLSQALSSYKIDFTTMEQIQIRTGNRRPVQRQILSQTSSLGKGIVWAFEGNIPSSWTNYDVLTTEKLEEAYSNYQPGSSTILDLQVVLQQPYIIDFGNMTQTRCDTRKVRKIQRTFLNRPYPSPLSSASGTQSGGLSSSSLAISSQPFQSGQGTTGPSPWHCQAKSKSSGQRARSRHQPYINHVNAVSNSQIMVQAGVQTGSGGAQAGYVLSQGLSHQLSQGPVTRGRMQQQLSNNGSGATSQSSGNNPSVSVPYLQQQAQLYSPSPSSHIHHLHHHHLQQQQQQHHLSQHIHFGASAMPNAHYPVFMNPNLINPPSALHGGYTQYSHAMAQPVAIRPPGLPPPPPAHQQSQVVPSAPTLAYTPPQESLPTTNKIVIGKTKKSKPKTGLELLKRYMESIHDDLDKEDCIICCDKLSEASSYGEGKPEAHDAVKLNRCGHKFHKLCLLEMYNSVHKDDSVQCPSCKTIYGEKTGICPPGYMMWKILDGNRLAGYENYNTIHVSYHISPGTQGPEHPNPGEKFSTHGFPRQGFLPDCDKGRKVLKLLITAFKRRLMFTIGTSHTTGATNTVTWNEIHHKTELHGNYSGHGYPDPNYLDNVLAELAAHGVTEDCLS